MKPILAAVLAACLLAVPAFADEPELKTGARPAAEPEVLDIEIRAPKGSLEAILADPAANMAGVVFDIWRIDDGSGGIAEAFKAASVDVDFDDSAHWLDDASALEAHARAENIKPLASPSTDETGTFRQSDLEMGMYLVAAQDFVRNDVRYELQAFLVPVPCMGSFEVSAAVKAKASPVPPKETVIRRVTKTWKNDSSRTRPDSITVDLLKDGKVDRAVVLSDDNNWTYTWEGLPAENTWTVRERDVPSRYSTRTHREGITFQLVNVRRSDYEPVPTRPSTPRPYDPTPNPGTVTPSPTPTGTPSAPGLVDIQDNQTPLGPLPQAGANWIPVFLCGALGLALLVLACLPDKKSK